MKKYALLCCLYLGLMWVKFPVFGRTIPDLKTQIVRDTAQIPPYRTTLNGEDAFRKDVFEAINTLRQSGCNCGGRAMPKVAALVWNDTLANAALRHSKDMAAHHYFNHKGADGSNVATRTDALAYRWKWLGENLLYYYNVSDFGTVTPANKLVNTWVASVEHCKNMMSPNYTQSGLAVSYFSKNGIKNEYYTQVFASPRK